METGFPDCSATNALHVLLEHMEEGAYYVDLNRNILFWNQAAERISGYSSNEVIGHCCGDNILCHMNAEGTELCIGGCPLHITMNDGSVRKDNLFLHHKDGHRVPISIRAIPVRQNDGAIIGGLELFTDISDRSALLAHVEKLRGEVLIDELTGIGNRKYGKTVLAQRFRELKDNQVPFALVMIDIDDFKQINDGYGHEVGDRVLRMVAGSLDSALRRGDVLWRWGGEEFAAVFSGVNRQALAAIADRLRLFVKKSWIINDGKEIRVTVSLGGTLAFLEDDEDSLFERADRLMYSSKKEGKNRLTIG